ncbi:MAG: thioredoxin domain-containing protein [Ornithinimicrobium sp.]
MTNQLGTATSPYLLQHAQNPVDWWPWTEGAFAAARELNRPVLLSVGYAACHWCHVMAHESFEDQQVAAAINEDYIAIKVDREERPDVDAVYMQATTAMTGHGGWPMTCLLTPQAEPFWCGTYLPKQQFLRLLEAGALTWRQREDEVRTGAARIIATLENAQRQEAATAPGTGGIDAAALTSAVDLLHQEFDQAHGGFGGAPKFPPSMVLSFLARHAARTGEARALQMAERTAEALARSGIYDQLGGGFARYAVDRAWVVPHFEKMLYDNALLLRAYTDLARASSNASDSGHRLAERVVGESVDWLIREMWTEQAGFASSLDADTQGVEGATYVWTPEQLIQVLGPEDGERAATIFSVTADGTFEHGTSTVQLREEPEDTEWFSGVRERLHLHRTLRPQPGIDDKVVTAWNGWTIAALAEAGWYFEEPDWIDVAARCADLLLSLHLVDGRLRRSSRHGTVSEAHGVAEDYGALIEGLLALHAATGEHRWLTVSGELLDTALALFGPPDDAILDATTTAEGSSVPLEFTLSSRDVNDLVMTSRPLGDNAEPCGQSALAGALLRYSTLALSPAHRDAGIRALAAMAPIACSAPRFAGWALAVAEDALTGPAVLAIASADGGLERAQRRAPAGMQVLTSPAATIDASADAHRTAVSPVLQARPARDGRDTAYLCRGMTCLPPITDPDELIAALDNSVNRR